MRRHETSPPTSPSTDQWQRLYAAAAAFKALEPWGFMAEEDVFGVANPVDSEVGYCTVLGGAGEVFALVVYLGSEGLEVLQLMASGVIGIGDPDVLTGQKCLMATFEDRNALEAPDRKVVKQLGLKFRGRGNWPLFRSCRPGYFPWFLTGAEANFLVLALEQAVEVCGRFAADPRALKPPKTGHYLVRVRAADGAWGDAWQLPVAPQEEAPAPTPPISELELARVGKAARKRAELWEGDLFLAPLPTADKHGQRPYYPVTVMWVDAASGMVLHSQLHGPGTGVSAAVEGFLSAAKATGTLPLTIEVGREDLARALQSVTSRLGVEVRLADDLPALDQARDSLFAFFGH
jgi:hypothetical protein